MSTSNHPFLEFPQIKPPLLMMGKTIKWKPNTIEVAPSCPRCFSSNTKFCYYNNYSVSQPRYFCKACRRYWTKGGSLRNVPIGGGCRKSRRTRAARRESPPPAETANGSESGVAAASAKHDDRNVLMDYECSNFTPSSAISECGETVGVIDGGDEQVQRVHGCFDGRDFECGNFGVFEVDGIDFGSEMLCSNLEDFGCEQPPLLEMQEFEVFATDNDDDRLLRMSDENLITDNWASFDLSAYEKF